MSKKVLFESSRKNSISVFSVGISAAILISIAILYVISAQNENNVIAANAPSSVENIKQTSLTAVNKIEMRLKNLESDVVKIKEEQLKGYQTRLEELECKVSLCQGEDSENVLTDRKQENKVIKDINCVKKTVKVPLLYVRGKPKLNGKIVSTLKRGDTVCVLPNTATKAGGYTWMRIDRDQEKWIANSPTFLSGKL